MNAAAKKWALLLFVGLILAAVVIRRSGFSRRYRAPRAPLAQTMAPGQVGAVMPEFHLRDLAGREVSSEQFRGKVLVVDFWATWCEPCKVEMPGFQQLQDRYAGRGLVVVGIALDADASDVARFANQLGVHYTLLLSTDEVEKQFGGILGIPTTFVMDRHGVIRKKVIGFEYKEAFETTVKEIL